MEMNLSKLDAAFLENCIKYAPDKTEVIFIHLFIFMEYRFMLVNKTCVGCCC